ncbi:MAG TPA: D-alanine--D-alanine ligase family protein [Pyrinomonadaceae bacterium]|jgi:D-alanine-D-alanine ligase|nr:D-alanine--D-alanine ligase family protein [Pyrinomonadaceae bacterium]
MSKKIRVGVVFGGRSGEHEVSVRSARAVIEAIDAEKYEVVPIGITKEGRWLSPAEAVTLLPAETRPLVSDEMSRAEEAVTIIGDPSRQGLSRLAANGEGVGEAHALDVVFPVLHGTYGEDGTLQGLLEMAGIAYVGSGVLGSSCGMDKVAMKALFRDAGLPICKYEWFLRSEWERERVGVVRRIAREIGFPAFVKPANLGSSVGVSKATDKRTLADAIDLAARYDRKLIVEEGLDAREIECAVMGNDEPEASLPGEYVVYEEQAKFLDYTEKYSNTGRVEFVVPAPLPKRLTERVQRMAKRAFQSVDCAGFARVDFFLRRDTNELLVNELNTIPGLTDLSGFPKMWAASGIPFPQVLERLIELALERQQDKLRNQTSI